MDPIWSVNFGRKYIKGHEKKFIEGGQSILTSLGEATTGMESLGVNDQASALNLPNPSICNVVAIEELNLEGNVDPAI